VDAPEEGEVKENLRAWHAEDAGCGRKGKPAVVPLHFTKVRQGPGFLD